MFIVSFFAYLSRRARERAAVRALGNLSDHHLKDIGLTRGAIAVAVRQGRP